MEMELLWVYRWVIWSTNGYGCMARLCKVGPMHIFNTNSHARVHSTACLQPPASSWTRDPTDPSLNPRSAELAYQHTHITDMLHFLYATFFIGGITGIGYFFDRYQLPYWPCEISRILACSKKAKYFAWVAITPVLFYHWTWRLLIEPGDLMALGLLGVVWFDDFEHLLLHSGSVVVIVIAAIWQNFVGSTLRLSLIQFAIMGLAFAFPVLHRSWHVAMYEHPDPMKTTWEKLTDFKQLAGQTRRIHLSGNTVSEKTIQSFGNRGVMQWCTLVWLAFIFDL